MKRVLMIIVLVSNIVYSQGSWYPQNSGTTRFLNEVFFVDKNTGWVGGDSILLKTTNGGNNWVEQVLPVQIKIRSIHFLNSSTGFLSGEWSVPPYASYLYVLKTTNSGFNWYQANYFIPGGFTSAFSNKIFAFNENAILKSYTEFQSYSSNGSIMKSTNGGINFYTSIAFGESNGFSFINSQTGWAISYGANASPIIKIFKVYKTTNQGESWTSLYKDSSITAPKPIDIQFLNASTGYMLCLQMSNIILKSTNGGSNWNIDTLHNNYKKSLFFLNQYTGWIAGFSNSSNGIANIQRTTNGGINWINENTNSTVTFNKIFFVDSLTGWAVGYYGAIYKTPFPDSIHTISGTVKYADNNQPVTGGYVKALKLNYSTMQMETIDSTGIQSNGTYTLPNVRTDSVYIRPYPNSTIVVDFIPTYYPSSITWENATVLYVTSNLNNIDVGVVRVNISSSSSTISGNVYKTTYNPLPGLKDALLYVKFNNEIKGFAFSNNEGYYLLNNMPTGSYKVYANRPGYKSDSVAVIMPPGGTLSNINYTLYPAWTSIKKLESGIVTEYKLEQNYPNPFNSKTKIKFEVKKSGNVKLKVFDITGKLVADIVNAELETGRYEVLFDAKNLSSSIYFYRMETGDFVESKRMVHIK